MSTTLLFMGKRDHPFCEKAVEFVRVHFTAPGIHLARLGDAWVRSAENWARKPFQRQELEDLCRIDPDMNANEIAWWNRAVSFPGAPGAFIENHGHHFTHNAGNRRS